MARFGLKTLSMGAIAGLLLASCSNSSDVDPVQRKLFAAKADAACKIANGKFAPLFETDFPAIAEQIPGFFAKAAPIIRDRADGLKAAGSVEGDESKVSQIVKLAGNSATDFERAAKDQKLGQKLFNEEGGKDEADFRKKSKAYGLTDCAKDAGDEGNESSPKKMDPSGFSAEKKAYVAEADEICTQADKEFMPVEESLFASFPPTMQAWADGLPKLIAIFGPATEKQRQLTLPPGDEAEINRILDEQADVIAKLTEGEVAAKAGDAEKFTAIIGPIFERFDQIDSSLRAYGFQVCGSEDEE